MDLFLLRKCVPSSLLPLIKCAKKACVVGGESYSLFTYTLKKKKRKTPDDQIYADHPELVAILPRACSVLVGGQCPAGAGGQWLEGPRKFSGMTPVDEDEEFFGNARPDNDHGAAAIQSWHDRGHLEVVETEKANGKFAIVRIVDNLLLFGSKNCHFVVGLDAMTDKVEQEGATDLVRGMFTDIRTTLPQIQRLQPYFDEGYSLVGEYCDGCHFTEGDCTIRYFGLFLDGVPLPCLEGLRLLQSVGVRTVAFRKVEDPCLHTLHLASRSRSDEGCVLYFRNTETGEVVLVKYKSALYIVKRFLREILLNRGYRHMDHLANRFVEARAYHGLDTTKSIELTNVLIKFGTWMMDRRMSPRVLMYDAKDGGFHKTWTSFCQETGTPEPRIEPKDFGTLDECEYRRRTQLYEPRDYRREDRATIVFLQGIPGSGKTTLAREMVARLDRAVFLEQDQFGGDTAACQGVLYHLVNNSRGPNYIVVSRCNLNERHYGAYVKLCHALPTRVLFVAPRLVDETYLAASLAASQGRGGEDLTKIIRERYEEFEVHPQAHRVSWFCGDDGLLRRTVADLADECVSFARAPLPENVVAPVFPTLVGLAVGQADRRRLVEFLDQHAPRGGIVYCHHCTLAYLGGTKDVRTLPGIVSQDERVEVTVHALVIRKIDGACAFRVRTTLSDNETPHITAKLPYGTRPNASNEFVGRTDASVTIVPCLFVMELTSFYA